MTIAQQIADLGYNATRADVERAGGVWDENFSIWNFPDGSWGEFGSPFGTEARRFYPAEEPPDA